jgi:FixJ family two-component response regulator
MTHAMLEVTIVDDDASVLRAISRLLRSAGFKPNAFAAPREFLEAYNPDQTGCILLDLTMPGLSGLELQQILRDRGGAPPIIFLSGTGDIPSSVNAMRHGAVDFLVKPVDEEALLRAVESALERERTTRRQRLELIQRRRQLHTLTAREREVLEQVVTGRLNKQIAADLGTVEKTIKVHRARVMEKLHVNSLAELVQLADRLEITPRRG